MCVITLCSVTYTHVSVYLSVSEISGERLQHFNYSLSITL